jgi:phosphoserine phosphatase RsbU/P
MVDDSQTRCSSCRLLVVDSDSARRTELALLLAQQGYAVSEVLDQGAALELLRAQEFDLVLLDVRTAQEGGYALLTGLRPEERGAMLPVLATAAPDDEAGVAACLAMGATDYLLAPFRAPLLRVRIDASLETWQLRRESRRYLKDEARIKLEHDLQVARRIQAGFLPTHLPEILGWEIAARFDPAREVAGDFYDAFMLSQNRRLGFVIADVVDKGVPAAIFMALVRSLTRAFAQQNYPMSWTDALEQGTGPRRPRTGRSLPSTGTVALENTILLTNNYIVANHSEDTMFATMFFGMADPATGQVIYINGGHNPPYIVASGGEIKGALKPTGPAVGMFPSTHFDTALAQLDPGDTLFIYTDGVTEAKDPQGRLYTARRLESLLSEQPVGSAVALLDRVQAALQAHMADAEQFDDITMLAVRRTPTAG